ncbi:hypothetical protein GCM10023148_11070 [Actinokineospora soli]
MVRRSAFAAAALALALTGCSGDNNPGTPAPAPQATTATTTTGGAGGDAVAWAERVCASVGPEVEKLSAGPDIDPSNPQAAKEGLVTYLDTLISAIDRMIGGMRDAGAPPVPDGQIAADRAVGTLEEAKGSVSAARDELAAADVSDPAAFQAAFTKVGEDLQKLSELENPMEGLRGNEELDAAFEQAESCKKLSGSSAAPTPTS